MTAPTVDMEQLPLWDLRTAMRTSGFPIEPWGLPPERLAAVRTTYDEFASNALRLIDV